MKRRSPCSLLPHIGAIVMLSFGGSLMAQSITWDGGPSGTGTDWATGENWAGDVAPADDITTNTATFNTVTTGQPVVAGPRSVYGIDFANASGGWTLSGAGTLTLGSKGIDATAWTSGTNTLSVANIIMGSGTDATWSIFANTGSIATASTFDVTSNIQVNSAATLDFFSNRSSGAGGGIGTINLSGVISGTISTAGKRVGFRGNGASSNRNTINVTGANTYNAPTLIQAVNLNFNSLANAGSASSFGNSGVITLVDNTSFAVMNYTGTETGQTDRLLIHGGSAAATINNNGLAAISFNNTGALMGGTASNRSLTLGGTYTGGTNIMAEQISDMTGFTTSLSKGGASTWKLTNTNAFTGGVTLSGGTLAFNADAALGASSGAITFTQNASLVATDGATLGSGRTITVSSARTASFGITSGTGTTLVVDSKITGAGSVSRLSGAISTTGGVRFSNDTNNYTGSFGTGFGLTEFTSVANAGLASSLGAGSDAYSIGNSVSAATLRYVGSSNTSTTRAINWSATTGAFSLESSGVGTVSFLSGTALVTADGNKTLTLGGSNLGDNTFAQPIHNGPTSGTTSLQKSGDGKWILSGTHNYGGATTVSGGTLAVTGSAANSAFTVSGTGKLSGTGTIGALTVSTGGTVNPGNSPGMLNTGNFQLNGGTYLAEMFSASSYDQINVAGTVSLNGALSLSLGYTPAPEEVFFLILNDGLDLVSGTFSGLAEGAILTSDDTSFKITYLANSTTVSFTGGNDVALMVVPEPSTAWFTLLGLGALLRRRRG